MRLNRCICGVMLVLVGALLASITPARAQGRAPAEQGLANVLVGSSFQNVLERKSAPHIIGPALPSVDAIWDILDPLPIQEVDPTAMTDPAAGGMKPRPKLEYIVWLYEGSSYNTYVLFNKSGLVAGVIVLWNGNTPPERPVPMTASGIGFGSRLTEVIGKYDWPEPFARVGSHYFCSYPSKSVTYALDISTRKVMAIAVGVSLTVLPITAQAGEGGTTGVYTPGMPGGMPGTQPMPY